MAKEMKINKINIKKIKNLLESKLEIHLVLRKGNKFKNVEIYNEEEFIDLLYEILIINLRRNLFYRVFYNLMKRMSDRIIFTLLASFYIRLVRDLNNNKNKSKIKKVNK